MRAAGTKGVPRALRERQLLDIAGEQIGRVGYAGMSPALVAEAAGVSKPMVYQYFGSKDGLYVACVERAAEEVCGAIDPVIDGPAGVEIAERTLEAIFGALGEHPFNWNVLLDDTHPSEGAARDAVHAARARLAAQATRGTSVVLGARGITDAVDLAAFAEVWMAMVAALVDWWAHHPAESAEAMTARCRRLMGTLFGGSAASDEAHQRPRR
jgi:AcrR family transcriptional regulator